MDFLTSIRTPPPSSHSEREGERERVTIRVIEDNKQLISNLIDKQFFIIICLYFMHLPFYFHMIKILNTCTSVNLGFTKVFSALLNFQSTANIDFSSLYPSAMNFSNIIGSSNFYFGSQMASL